MSEKDFFKILYGKSFYSLSYEQIPTNKLLIGKGFLWTPMHTKILHDLMQDKEALERSSDKGGLSFIHGVGIKMKKTSTLIQTIL